MLLIRKLMFLAIALLIADMLDAQWEGTGAIYYTGGNVGIGTTNPSVSLDVVGQIKSSSGLTIPPSASSSYGNTIYSNDGLISFTRPNTTVPGTELWKLSNGGANANNNPAFAILSSNADGSNAYRYMTLARANGYGIYNLWLDPDGTSGVWIGGNTSGGDLRVQGNSYLAVAGGNVGIGTTDTKGYKLAVNGNAIFVKVKVQLYQNWADYVFHPTYRLRPLSEVEQYIHQYHHLPEVPSTEEVEKEGLDVGESQATLLKKIEELTLYLIEQNKRIEKLEAANEQLRLENQAIKESIRKVS